MFERFTDDGRRVVVLSQEEARARLHHHIGPEHLLLGVTRLADSDAARALEALGVELDELRANVDERIGRGGTEPGGHIPFTDGAKRVLESTLRESLAMGHTHIGTEHILLGIFGDEDGVAAEELTRLGVDPTQLREHVAQLGERDE